MPSLRRLVFALLPKVALSRCCGACAALPLPTALRRPFYRWFARRYGANLAEVAGDLTQFRSLAQFFRRPLQPGARPIASTPFVAPCDGKVVTAGPLQGEAVPQVKGMTYSLSELLADADLARQLASGSQMTIYLAPGDYHRVHAPFAGSLASVQAIAGTLFPVNPPAVACIPRLFARNSRHVYKMRCQDGRAAAVVLVGAYNVGATLVSASQGEVQRGDELGQFGFGSTVVVVVAPGGPALPELAPETRLRMGEALLDSNC